MLSVLLSSIFAFSRSGGRKNWNDGIYRMPRVALLTQTVLFVGFAEDRFGKDGLGNHLQPQTTTASSSAGRSMETIYRPKDLDHTSLNHEVEILFISKPGLVFGRAALCCLCVNETLRLKKLRKLLKLSASKNISLSFAFGLVWCAGAVRF